MNNKHNIIATKKHQYVWDCDKKQERPSKQKMKTMNNNQKNIILIIIIMIIIIRRRTIIIMKTMNNNQNMHIYKIMNNKKASNNLRMWQKIRTALPPKKEKNILTGLLAISGCLGGASWPFQMLFEQFSVNSSDDIPGQSLYAKNWIVVRIFAG